MCMEKIILFVRTRSFVGCFLSYDYPLAFIYLPVYYSDKLVR